ncbi:MAG TPA: helix-turn-helix domain-containing protein [Casimicrobiaceae bacterium]|nr:helix-turn-helix domain-containing protein [Casimicrobiaceae bacterium]
MPERTYSMETRAAQAEATRERIVRAAVRLHAERGAVATPFAAIARKARVSPQTVYNHFPDLGALIGACTGHVAALAPHVDEGSFRAGVTAADRLRLLARAIYARIEYFAPWLRQGYHDAAKIPELAAVFARSDDEVRRLAVAALAPDRESLPGFTDAAFVLLDYPAWKTLTRGRSTGDAAHLAGEGLADLVPRLTRPLRKAHR